MISKSVPCTIDKPRNLRFTINSIADMEQMTGLRISQLDPQRASFAEARGLLYAATVDEDRSMTLQKAGNLIQQYGMGFMDKLGEALALAFPDAAGNPQTTATEESE
jgi:hypothetical protein